MNASGDYSICGPQVPVRPLTAVCLDRLLCLAFALQHSHQLQHQKPLMETLFETPESLLLVMLVIQFNYLWNSELNSIQLSLKESNIIFNFGLWLSILVDCLLCNGCNWPFYNFILYFQCVILSLSFLYQFFVIFQVVGSKYADWVFEHRWHWSRSLRSSSEKDCCRLWWLTFRQHVQTSSLKSSEELLSVERS